MTLFEPSFLAALLAGGIAGTSVDVALYPLDTIKTRLQSANGFLRSGIFRGIYAGLGSAVVGSAPGAAVFFATYELVKKTGNMLLPQSFAPITHMFGASCGEIVACIIRVPVEVVKQRSQASPSKGSMQILRITLQQEGFKGFYRGYFSTIVREIPFSLIQFPIWEFLKKTWSNHQNYYVESWQASICGAVAGGIAACLTTPLDVAKTRIILAEKGTKMAKGSIIPVLQSLWLENGVRGLFAGMLPRVIWISLGGAIFLGVYEKAKKLIVTSQHS